MLPLVRAVPPPAKAKVVAEGAAAVERGDAQAVRDGEDEAVREAPRVGPEAQRVAAAAALPRAVEPVGAILFMLP